MYFFRFIESFNRSLSPSPIRSSIQKNLFPVKNPKQKGIVNRACWFTGARKFDLLPFDSVSEMDKYMVDGDNSSQVFYGINFKNDEWKLNTTGVPNKLDYALRPVSSPRSETDVQGTVN